MATSCRKSELAKYSGACQILQSHTQSDDKRIARTGRSPGIDDVLEIGLQAQSLGDRNVQRAFHNNFVPQGRCRASHHGTAIQIHIRNSYPEPVAGGKYRAQIEPCFDRPRHRAAIAERRAYAREYAESFIYGMIDSTYETEFTAYRVAIRVDKFTSVAIRSQAHACLMLWACVNDRLVFSKKQRTFVQGNTQAMTVFAGQIAPVAIEHGQTYRSRLPQSERKPSTQYPLRKNWRMWQVSADHARCAERAADEEIRVVTPPEFGIRCQQARAQGQPIDGSVRPEFVQTCLVDRVDIADYREITDIATANAVTMRCIHVCMHAPAVSSPIEHDMRESGEHGAALHSAVHISECLAGILKLVRETARTIVGGGERGRSRRGCANQDCDTRSARLHRHPTMGAEPERLQNSAREMIFESPGYCWNDIT